MFIRHKFILHVQRVFFTRFNVLIRSTGSRTVVPSSSAHTFEQNISNLNCLPTHKSIANIFDAILDVVSLEESKGLGDELSSFTCPILNNRGWRFACHAKKMWSPGPLLYYEAYLFTVSIVTMVFVFRIDTKGEQRSKLEGKHLWVCHT